MKRFQNYFTWLAILCVFLFTAACSQSTNKKVDSKPWPTKPVTIEVWSAAGSGVDVMARQAAKFLEKDLGQSFVVENKTGGDGAEAMQALLAKPADGYTIGANTRSQMVSLNADLKGQVNPDSFDFIAEVQGDPYVLAVLSSSGIKTMDDFLKAVNDNPNFAVGGFGANSAHNVFAEDLAKEANFKLNWIPFKGGSEATTQLLGGHIQAALTNAGQVMQLVKSGNVTVIGISTKERLSEMPDTPTFKELGYTGLDVTHWRGFYVKKGTPKEVVAKLDEEFKKLSQDPEWQKQLKAGGLTNDFLSSVETAKSVAKDLKMFDQKLNKK